MHERAARVLSVGGCGGGGGGGEGGERELCLCKRVHVCVHLVC